MRCDCGAHEEGKPYRGAQVGEDEEGGSHILEGTTRLPHLCHLHDSDTLTASAYDVHTFEVRGGGQGPRPRLANTVVPQVKPDIMN
jgi:hypothetical protein